MKKRLFLRIFFLLVSFFNAGEAQAVGSDDFNQQNIPNDMQSEQDVFPPGDKSFWIPYSDRTAGVMTFPVIPEQIFQPEVNEEVIPWRKWAYGVKQKIIAKPKSDVGVIVSRNYILKENFRDYRNLSRFPEILKPSDKVLLEMAKQLMDNPPYSPQEHFLSLAVESRMKTPVPLNTSLTSPGTFHNGTITLSSSRTLGNLMSIPFTLSNMDSPDLMLKQLERMGNQLGEREKGELREFFKLIHGIHKESFLNGTAAMDRFLQRSGNLKRPSFFIPVESSPAVTLEDPEDEAEAVRVKNELYMKEESSRNVAWLHSSTIAMRVISSPSFYTQQVTTTLPPIIKFKVEKTYGHYGPAYGG